MPQNAHFSTENWNLQGGREGMHVDLLLYKCFGIFFPSIYLTFNLEITVIHSNHTLYRCFFFSL